MLRFGLWKKCRSGADVAAGLWWLQNLAQSEGRTQTGSAANEYYRRPPPKVVEAAANRLKQGLMMDNATDSRINAHLLSTVHYVAACNALLLALSAKYGGAWFAGATCLAAVLLYRHIRIHFDRRVFQDFADNRYSPEDFDHTHSKRFTPNFRQPYVDPTDKRRTCPYGAKAYTRPRNNF